MKPFVLFSAPWTTELRDSAVAITQEILETLPADSKIVVTRVDVQGPKDWPIVHLACTDLQELFQWHINENGGDEETFQEHSQIVCRQG